MAWVNIVDYLDQFVISWGDIGFKPADPQYPGPRSFSLVNDEFVLDRPTWSGAYRSRLMVSKRGDATVNYSDIRIRTLGYHEYHASGNTGNFYPSGVILQYGQEAWDTEVVQNNFDYPAVAMDPSTVVFSEFITEGAPYGIGFQTAGGSFNYETFYADGAFVIELNIGDDPEPPGDCFWTDIVGASQDCDGGVTPEPPADFTFISIGYVPKTASPIDGNRCVLVNDFSIYVLDFSVQGDPLIGSLNFGSTTRAAYFVGGFFYWFGVDYSTNPDGDLLCVMLPENEVIGSFEVYSGPRTNINAVTGFNATHSFVGALPDPDSVAGLLLLRDNNTQATKLFSTTTGTGADSWSQLASAPNTLSDVRLTYDPQLAAPLLTANNGAPGDLLVWWAYKVTAGGWTLMQEATNGNVGYSSAVNWWSAVGKFVGVVNDAMSVINSDGTTSPFAGGGTANALFPYDGTKVFKAPSHNCEDLDVFGTMHDSTGAVVETTTANFKYMGCQCYLAMPAAKVIIGRMSNQCL